MKKDSIIIKSTLVLGSILTIGSLVVSFSGILLPIAKSLSPDGILKENSIIAIKLMPVIAVILGLILFGSAFVYKYFKQISSYIEETRWFDVSLKCLLLIFFIRILVLIIFIYGDGFIEVNPSNSWIFTSKQTTIASKADEFLRHLRNWDGNWYYEIGQQDYRTIYNKWENENLKYPLQVFRFFPLYPYLMRVLNYIVHNLTISGLIISNISFFIFIIYLYKLANYEFGEKVAFKTAFYASIFPSSFFLSVVYTEALFLALIVSSFYAARKQRWWIAAVLGLFAAMTRSTGVFLTIPLFFEYLRQLYDNKKDVIKFKELLNIQFIKSVQIKSHFWAIFIIPIGYLLVLINFWRTSGDPFIFVKAHTQCQSGFMTLNILISELLNFSTVLIIYPFMLIIGLLVFKSKQFLRTSYFAYAVLFYSLHLLHSHTAFIRFSLEIFPVFIILGYFANKNKIIDLFLTVISTAFLTIFAVMFINGYWVS